MNQMSLLLFLFVFLTIGEAAMALEQPKYEIVESSDDIEIRRYQSYIAARTEVEGNFDNVGNEAFRRLGGFIFGDNSDDEKISMTAPVAQGRSAKDGSYWVTFMMPASYSLQSLPQPRDARVILIEQPGEVYAVLKYRGGWSQKKYLKNEQRLRDFMALQTRWEITGDAVWARYNPPFVPAFLRRNEVLIPITRKEP